MVGTTSSYNHIHTVIDTRLPVPLQYALFRQKLHWLDEEHKKLWKERNGGHGGVVDVAWWQQVCQARRETGMEFQCFLQRHGHDTNVFLRTPDDLSAF